MVKRTKRILALCLALTMVFACLTITASATTAQYFTFTPTTVVTNSETGESYQRGEVIKLTVKLSNPNLIKGIQGTINYDPTAFYLEEQDLAVDPDTEETDGRPDGLVPTSSFTTNVWSYLIKNDLGYTNFLGAATSAKTTTTATTVFNMYLTVKDTAVSGNYTISLSETKISKEGGVLETMGTNQTASITLDLPPIVSGPVDPTITSWPTVSAITYGQTIGLALNNDGVVDAANPGTFSISEAADVKDVGTYPETITFTPNDVEAFNVLTQSTSVTVNKATPTVTAWPTASAITYGAALGTAISGGTASVPGSFAIANAASVPNAGDYTNQVVTFAPTDTTNYNTVAGSVNVTVNKADPVVTWPTTTTKTYSPTLTLANVTLPAGFEWVAPTTSLGVGTNSYSVKYTPADATNYNILFNDVSVTVDKGNQVAPSLTIASKTDASITIATVPGAVYALKAVGDASAVVYGASNEFTGLTSNTEYTAYIKLSATANYNESAAASAVVKTNKSDNDDINHDKDQITLPPVVTGPITLPGTGESGTTITWGSNKPGVVNGKGRVIKPSAAEGSQEVILTATVKKNGVEDTKEISVTVPAMDIAPAMTFGKFNAEKPVIAMKGPSGVAVDAAGNIWVTDYNNNRVVEYGPTGTFIKSFGTAGSGDAQFNKPNRIAIAADGTIFVADTYNNRIVKFNADGTGWAAWGGVAGTGAFQFKQPCGIAVSGDTVYVADTYNHRLVTFNAATSSDWTVIGSYGTTDSKFFFPMDIAVGADGDIWVADTNNNVVKRLTSDGEFLVKYAAAMPYGVAVDAEGNAYASLRAAGTIKCVNNTKSLVVGDNSYAGKGTQANQFTNPTAMTIDAAGNMWVVDVTTSTVKQAVMN